MTDSMRWQMSSRINSFLSVLFGLGLHDLEPEAGDRLVEDIWYFCGKEMADLAKGCGSPPRTAGDLSVALTEVLKTIFGGEYRSEIIEISDERAVVLMRTCPCQLRALELGEDPSIVFHPCLSVAISLVEGLKNNYSARFVRGICMGDRNCEILIAPKESLQAKE